MRLAGYMNVALMMAGVFGSCIGSHVPLPDIEGTIISFEVEGQVRSTVNAAMRTVTVELAESVDMKNAKVTKMTLCEGGSCEIAVGDVLDLSEPQTITVTTVAGYEWTVSATQTIERRFGVAGQVGTSYFELHSRSAFAYVSVGTFDRKTNPDGLVKILSLKLWPEGVAVTLDPAIKDGDTKPFRTSGDGTRVRDITVKYRDVVETWHLYVAQTDIAFEGIDPFARHAYLSAYGDEGADNWFEYRLASVPEWTRVPDEMMTGNEKGIFSATLTGLTPETEYVVRAVSGDTAGEEEHFTTGGERALPGAGFDYWSKTGNVQNPWPAGAVWEVDRWWDTGNRGVAAVAPADGGNSLPDPGAGCPADPNGTAAKLQTRWAAVKTAGGNIYFGQFGEMFGLDATCHLGHNWQQKPTGLKGWFKYFPQPVDEVSEKHAALHPYGYSREKWMGSPDSLHVCVALWASPDGRNIPFTVNTDTSDNGRKFVDFSRDKPGVIAYGAFVSARQQSEWAEFTIEMDYLKTGALPANTQLYLLVTASKNCNYFIAGTGRRTGGVGSLMYVDELELVYD